MNDFTFTAFTQTHYYRDQIIPLIFATFGTEGTDSTIGGNTEWLITDHWSASVGFDALWASRISTTSERMRYSGGAHSSPRRAVQRDHLRSGAHAGRWCSAQQG